MLCLASSLRAEPYLQLAWQPGLLLIVGVATGVGLYRRTQGGVASPHPLVLVAAVILLCAGLLDYASVVGLNSLDGVPAMNFAGPLMLLALAAPLIDGFIKTMHQAELARVELETRVREREQLLKRNFERLRESERVKVEAQERQRIMQDMHDGLGSQLMSSLMLVERGAVSNDQFAQILRESIDDMRLAIDALAAEDADLAAALGNLRFRMEPGDRLLLITDGISEARNAHGELYGFERANELIASGIAPSAITQAAAAFGQQDDMTAVAVMKS